MSGAMSIERDFQYNDKNFQFLRKKVKEIAGINLVDTKNELVYSRISRLLRQYHFKSFDEYCNHLNNNNPQMLTEFINAITTNFTSFMRERHHFEFLRTHILPQVYQTKSKEKRLRIWSAGCSTGEEPYSISFVVNDFFGTRNDWDIKILATDIDSDALYKAQQGIYRYDALENMPHSYQMGIENFFDRYELQDTYHVKDKYKRNVYFKRFNLMCNNTWPMRGPFDVIFCRNVMIYFERSAQVELIKAFLKLIDLNGYLILGHSESVPGNLQSQLKFVDETIYQRIQ